MPACGGEPIAATSLPPSRHMKYRASVPGAVPFSTSQPNTPA